MAKSFAPRVSKKQRSTVSFDPSLYRMSDEKLLKGAKLDEIRLKDIIVKEQVRTKFNDDSLKELAANIKSNGLIQPLVLHKKKGEYTLICGERRYRAMNLIKLEKAPCFVLEDKTEQELMAIQFSENSSRESLHYIDKADGVYNYQRATGASERKIVDALGISKTEVHRALLLAKLPAGIKEAAKKYDIEKYVLLEFDAIADSSEKKKIAAQIAQGEIIRRNDLKKVIRAGNGVISTGRRKSAAAPANPLRSTSAQALLKAMQGHSKNMGLDKNTRKALETLLKETKEIIEN